MAIPANSNALMSIITCTYNSEKYLPIALQSEKRQTYKNIEHIINDSYSSDRTPEIIEDYIESGGLPDQVHSHATRRGRPGVERRHRICFW